MKIFKLIKTVRVAELNGTLNNILQAHADTGIEGDAALQSIIDELLAQNQELTTALEQNRQLSEMEKYDETRDQAYRSVYYFLHGHTFVPEGTLPYVPAKTLFSVVEKYGLGINSLSYDEQTGQLNSLLEELSSESNQQHMNTIPFVGGMVDTLKQAQADFIGAYSNYATKLSEMKGSKSATELKHEILKTLNDKLVMYMRAMSQIMGNKHQSFASELSMFINKTNQNINERQRNNTTID